MRSPRNALPSSPIIGIFLLILLALATTAEGGGTNPLELPEGQAVLGRGFDPATLYDPGDVDQVNLFNGALSLVLPVGRRYPQNAGWSFGLNLVYSSSVWDFKSWPSDELLWLGGESPNEDQCATYTQRWPSRGFNAGLGWSLSLGRLYAPGGEILPEEQADDGVRINSGPTGVWRYDSPDGSSHDFFDELPGAPPTPAGEFVQYTTGGSYLRLQCVPAADPIFCAVEMPDGGKSFFEPDDDFPDDNAYRPTRIEDAFGNGVDIAYSGDGLLWTLTDEHGRELRVHFRTFGDAFGHAFLDQIEQPGPLVNGQPTTLTYDFEYHDPQVIGATTAGRGSRDSYPWGQTAYRPGCGPGDPAPCNLSQYDLSFRQLAAVILPDGSSWGFEYQEGSAQPSASAYLLQEARLPTGGKVQWDYRIYSFPTATQCPQGGGAVPQDWASCSFDEQWPYALSAGVRERRTYGLDGTLVGQWNYDQSLNLEPVGDCGSTENVEESVTVVVDPFNNKTRHYFSVFTNSDSVHATGDWRRSEFGLPFTRNVSLPAAGPQPERFLSTETWACSGPAPTRDPEDFTDCLKVQETYAHYRLMSVEDPLPPVFACDQPDVGTAIAPPFCRNLNGQAVASTTQHLRGEGSQQALEDVLLDDWDDLGHFRLTETTGDYCPTGAANPRTPYCSGDAVTRFTGYNPGGTIPDPTSPWLVNLFDERWIQEGDHQERETFDFDQSTGFLETRRVLADTTAPAEEESGATHDQVFEYEADGDGNLARESSWGGDLIPYSPGSTPEVLTLHGYTGGVLTSSRAVDPNAGTVFVSLVDREVDEATGLVIRETDAAGVGKQLHYDEQGRLVEIAPEDEAATVIEYCPALTVCATGDSEPAATVKLIHGTGGDHLVQTNVYFDGFGRVARERRLMPGGTFNERRRSYHAGGLLEEETTTFAAGGSPAGSTYYPYYDPFGRPTRINLPGHEPGAQRRIVNTWYGNRRLEVTTRNVARLRDGALQLVDDHRTEHYDRQGRLWLVEEQTAGPGEQDKRETAYRHDVAGRMTAVKAFDLVDAGCSTCQERAFLYDGLGFLRAERHPELSGSFPIGSETWNVLYSSYDSRGNLGRRQDGRSDLELFYDFAGRLVEVQDRSTGAPLQELLYGLENRDAAGGWQEAGADKARGKLVQVKQWQSLARGPGQPEQRVAVTESYRYQGRGGRLSEYSVRSYSHFGAAPDSYPALRFTIGLTFDDLGQLEDVSYPDCSGTDLCPASEPVRTVRSTYTNGWLGAVAEPSGRIFASSLTYHPNGLYAQLVHGNGAVDHQLADLYGQVRPLSLSTTGVTGGGWASGDYSYDTKGNVYRIGVAGSGDEYFYDDVDRLVEARLRSAGGLKVQRYAYDVFGNLLSVQDDGDLTSGNGSPGEGTNQFPANPATNRLTNLVYDVSGNVTSAPSLNLTGLQWDSLGNLRSLVGTGLNRQHLYTAAGERLATFDLAAQGCGAGDLCAQERWTIRGPGNRVLREYRRLDAAGAPEWKEKDYVYRGSSLLASVASDGTETHFHLDHLGSPRLITDGAGVRVAEHVYFPFGREATDRLQDFEPMKFTGHERDFHTEGITATQSEKDDLDYMHARYYSPWMGRFLSVDPVGGSPEIPQSWNRYAYVVGNPVRFVDPDGEETQLAVSGLVKGNPAGHVAIVVNGTVFSFGTFHVSESGDWGVNLGEYLSAQEGKREITLLTLDVSAEQEEKLLEFLTSYPPRLEDYSAVENSCVTSCEKALESAGILPNDPGAVRTNSAGSLLQAGASRSLTPASLVAQAEKAGLIKSSSTRGRQQVSRLRSIWGAIRFVFGRKKQQE